MRKSKQTAKILIAVAMETELRPLLKTLNGKEITKLLSIFPLYKSVYGNIEVYIIQTYVGDVNALLAGYEAIRTINPDCVIKFGAVGGSYAQSKAGDIIIPLGFFHRTALITRSIKTNQPTSNSALWQSVFGNLPYQVNSANLGGLPYYFPVSKKLTTLCKNSLSRLHKTYETAYVGGGNMWMFSKGILRTVSRTMLPQNAKHRRFVSDMESYALAYVCYVKHMPFVGCYIVASSDYKDEPYDPIRVPQQMQLLVPYVLDVIKSFNIAK